MKPILRKLDSTNIAEWKKRRGHLNESTFDIERQIAEIRSALQVSSDQYLKEFAIMRSATCLEVFIRESLKKLVDAGSPYLEAAEPLAKRVKVDLVLASEIIGSKFSIGDLIAHSVSINSVGDLVSHLSLLIDHFIPKLKEAHPYWNEEQRSWPLEPIIDDYDLLMSNLKSLFEVRHILTHELAETAAVDPLDIDCVLKSAAEFVSACEWVIIHELYGAVPRNQLTMNLHAQGGLDDNASELDQTLLEAANLADLDSTLLNESQKQWELFADKEASWIASEVQGGTMYPMMWAEAKSQLVKERETRLRQLIQLYEE